MVIELMESNACQFCANCSGCFMSEETANFLGYHCKLNDRINDVNKVVTHKCPNFKSIERDATKEKEIMII